MNQFTHLTKPICSLEYYVCIFVFWLQGDLADLSFPVRSGGLHPQGQGWLGGGTGLIWAVGVLWPLQLHFESLHADLKAIHGLDGGLSAARVIKAHKTWRMKGERWRQREDDRLAPDG